MIRSSRIEARDLRSKSEVWSSIFRYSGRSLNMNGGMGFLVSVMAFVYIAKVNVSYIYQPDILDLYKNFYDQ